MAERLNGGIAEVPQGHRSHSTHDLGTTLLRYTDLYNHKHILQRTLAVYHLTGPGS